MRTFLGWSFKACDEVCGKKKGRWNEEMKKAVSRKKDAH